MGKKKLKKTLPEPFRDSTPLLLRGSKREATENKLREEARLQKKKNLATVVGDSKPRSSSISLEVDQQVVLIEEVNPPSKIRKVIVPSKH